MTREYLKKAILTSTSNSDDVNKTVQSILDDIEKRGEAAAIEYAKKFDSYEGNIVLTKEQIESACNLVPENLKQDIKFAHDNVKRFAEVQKS